MPIDLARAGRFDEGHLEDADLAGLVAARICHDLVSPVGAIANGIDLVTELGGAPAEDELTLIRSSAERAGTMLRVLRMAFGRASGEAIPVAREALAQDLQALLTSRRVSVGVAGIEGPALEAPCARAVALLTLAGRGLLGLSGRLELTLSARAGLPVVLTVAGDAASIGEAHAGWMSGEPGGAPPEPREVEFALLPGAAAAAGARLGWEEGGGLVRLSLSAL